MRVLVVSSQLLINGRHDTMDPAWVNGTPAGEWTSAAIVSDGSYGVPRGLVSSFSVTSDGAGWATVPGLHLPARARRLIDASIEELLEERSEARDLLTVR